MVTVEVVKSSYAGCALIVRSTGFADRLDMECDSKEIRENSIT